MKVTHTTYLSPTPEEIIKKLVLASQSEGRKSLMDLFKLPYTIDVSNYEEDMTLAMPPRKLAMYLSKGKAQEVAPRHPNALIIAADSFVVFGNELLGKPHTKKRAIEMLTMLSGKKHSFVTGYTIIDTKSGKIVQGSDQSDIFFRKLDSAEIKRFVDKENILNKAGAYTVQGPGSVFIKKIEGSYTNIIGLPTYKISQELKKFGINLV